jgi:tRNA(fMet)-specific endonuclease VapC
MNGRYFLDTNAIIALLKGNDNLISLLHNASWIGASVISELEFLAFPDITPNDEMLFSILKNRIDVVSLDSTNTSLLLKIIQIRRTRQLKLPDAIIAASSIDFNSALVSNDVIFRSFSDIELITF